MDRKIRPSGVFALSILAMALGACSGEFAYKTGAGVDALRADEQACKQAGGGGAAYSQCMHAKGWTIAAMDQAEPVPAPSAPSAGTPQPSAPTSPGGVPAAPTSMEAPAADLSARIKVTGWANWGGGDSNQDIADCVAKLGPANQPDMQDQAVTRALLGCMHAKGWRGL